MIFEEVDDLQQKVPGSILRIDDEIFYASEANGHGKVYVMGAKSGESRVDGMAVDWQEPTLGNITLGGRAYYLSRRPIRKWKLGLNKSNIQLNPYSAIHSLPSLVVPLQNCYDNNYNDKGNWKRLMGRKKVILSQKYMISAKGLYFQGELIGKLEDDIIKAHCRSSIDWHTKTIRSLVPTFDIPIEFEEKKAINYDTDDI